MIAHALGQKVSSLPICEGTDKSEDSSFCTSKGAKETSDVFNACKPVPHEKKGGKFPAKNRGYDRLSEPEGNMHDRLTTYKNAANTENFEMERIGAAKRIFSQALGISSSNRRHDVNVRTNECKQTFNHQ